MCRLMPFFIAIGSIIEGSRLISATEVDLTTQFKAFYICDGCDKYTGCRDHEKLQCSDVCPICEHRRPTGFEVDYGDGSRLLVKDRKLGTLLEGFVGKDDEFDYVKFLWQYLKDIEKALDSLKQRLEEECHITFDMHPGSISCQECLNERDDTYLHRPFTHCTKHPKAVCFTKIGPCLIFKWHNKGRFQDEPEEVIITVDLVPVFPVKESNTMTLFDTVLKTLMKNTPPGWLKGLDSFNDRDKVLPGAFKKVVEDSSRKGDYTDIAIKISHFGPVKPFGIRPGQTLSCDVFFDEGSRFYEIYCFVKTLKTICKASVSSFFLKKIMLSPELQVMLGKNKKFDRYEILFQVLSHPEVKEEFQRRKNEGKAIDYKQWMRLVDKKKKLGNFLLWIPTL